jgi:hypothetical protein
MSRCLRDRTLWNISEGEGTEAQQAHLQSCAACRRRYQAFVHTVEGVSTSLRETPPPSGRTTRPSPVPIPWQGAVAGVALLLLLVGGGLWRRRVSPPPLPTTTHSEELLLLLEEINSVFVTTLDGDAVEVVDPMDDVAALSAALEE